MKTRKQLAEKLGVNLRWLPGGEDTQKIAEWIEQGRCRIEHRGHGNSPLLVFEDGGSMEIQTVRWAHTARGWCLVSIDHAHSREKTTHYDVCGTIDAVKKAIAEVPNLDGLQELLDDIEHMIVRMNGRRDEYGSLVDDLRETLDKEIRSKPVPPVFALLSDLRVALSQDPAEVRRNYAGITETAEAVRDVAQFLEYSLEDYRDMARQIDGLIQKVKGARSWG